MFPKAGEWSGKRVLVLGMAKSGIAVAKLLHRLGAEVTVNDKKPREETPEATQLEELGVRVILGGHPDHLLSEGVDLIVKNPGIPYHIPFIQQAIHAHIPIVTEVEVAGCLTDSPIIGISGSNGKTTTTSLVGEMLVAGGLKARVAGNIGTALTEAIQGMDSEEWLVTELSSFQLKGIDQFHPRIAALLNIVPTHLDYHQTMEDYVASKRQLFRNQTGKDIAILNYDDPVCRDLSRYLPSTVWWFSRLSPVASGVYADGGEIFIRLPEQSPRVLMLTKEVSLPGDHNLENALAAIAIALACGVSDQAISQVLRSFSGVEHRLEFVREAAGVRYYNDSKATNARATIQALHSFRSPIVLIAGGMDRGADFLELVPVFSQRVKALVAYGEAGPLLLQRASEAGIPAQMVENVTQGVQHAKELAQEGDIVLLSPSCASWDLYSSFEERGSIFKQAVHRL